MGRWNRSTPKTLRFYDRVREGLWIPRGYMRQLIHMCRRHQAEYVIDDCRRSLPPVVIPFRGNLKPFQKKAVEIMIAKDFGTLNAPTGCGKTVMGLNMIARRRQPTLIIVHTKDLAFQWIEQIKAFTGLREQDIGLIGSGKKSLGEKITVALVQSLYRYAEDIFDRIGHLIVDECHRTPSRTFTEAVTEFDCKYMLGLSATPWRRDKLSKLIFWHLGDVHYTVDTSYLTQKGYILKADIVIRETDFEPYHDPVRDYSKMLLELTRDDDRNRLIAMDVASEIERRRGVCLVLSDRKKHCETLQTLLRYKHEIVADLLTGDMPNDHRKRVLERLRHGKCRALIATGQLIGEGFDCPNLATLFLATPVRFSGRVIQYLGRVLRPSHEKQGARVFDYVDVKVGPLRSAAKARRKVYNKG